MITVDQLSTVRGATVYDETGSKIGKVGEVYLSDTSGEPEWVSVNTGLFGSSESFVPLAQAALDGDALRVPYAKSVVRDAPRVDAGGHLDLEDEGHLFRYYGVSEAAGSGRGEQARDEQAFDEQARDEQAFGERARGGQRSREGDLGHQEPADRLESHGPRDAQVVASDRSSAPGEDGRGGGAGSPAAPQERRLRRYVVLGDDGAAAGVGAPRTSLRERNTAAQQHLGELINAGAVDRLGEVFADGVVDHDPAPGAEGLSGITSFFTGLSTAFPDAHLDVETLVADEDQVAFAYTLTGTHSGEFMGIPATGRPVKVRGLQIARFVDGKIVERWGSSDELGILRQIGATVAVSA